VQTVGGIYFHQHNDGDENGDTARRNGVETGITCGDEVGIGTISWGWDGAELACSHVTFYYRPNKKPQYPIITYS